jgi:anti-sigma factor RsiW
MTWTCEHTEARLSDYLDGVLSVAEQTAFDAHVNSCQRCTPLVASVSHLLSGLHSIEQIETPPRLVYSILDKTLGPRESGWRAILGWVRSVASIRFAYGALSFAATLVIFATASGFNWRHPKVADLQPANIYRNADRQAHLVYARGTKFVNDLRVVPESSPEKHPGRSDGSKPAAPKQQNRANDITRQIELLAEQMPILADRLNCLPIARRLP